jgi:hypothetical protein
MYRPGLVSTVSQIEIWGLCFRKMIYLGSSCTACPEDLDSEGGRRSHKHTAELSDLLSLKALWDDYGIVGDLVVCNAMFRVQHSYLLIGNAQPFTSSFPRADL